MRDGSDIAPLDKRTPGVAAIEPLLFPRLDALYALREARLRKIAAQDDREDRNYFVFLARLVHAQGGLLRSAPLNDEDAGAIRSLAARGYGDGYLEDRLGSLTVWQDVYGALVDSVGGDLPAEVRSLLAEAARDRDALSRDAASLLRGEPGAVHPGLAVVLWAALSLCWAQAMNDEASGAEPPDGAGGEAAVCPCCGAPPVGSLILGGDREGLRYLQCSLCETRWHRVRGVCVACGASGKIDQWSLDDPKAPVQAETCGDCLSYLKVLRFDYASDLEMAADDLGSVTLDVEMSEQGFSGIGRSPFAFSSPAPAPFPD